MKFDTYLLLAVLSLSLPFHAAKASEESFTPAFKKCMSNSNGITVAMRDCYNDEIIKQDARLNKNYKAFLASHDGDTKKSFVEAQRLWLKYRDANCNAWMVTEAGGTLALLVGDSCNLKMTAQRADELEIPAPFSGIWRGERGEQISLSLTLKQTGNEITGTYCYMDGGDQIDCPAIGESDPLHGVVKGSSAIVWFPSTGGEPDKRKARITLKKEGKISWELLEDPDCCFTPTPHSFETLNRTG
ncbi:lysozyme inhibitor LprI family protein [Pantoea cypripedii]|uniref:lysozyme inhibitor LprI family protein n=1 Tax=Pantoea cypripedii TaxID=55209 RepID=UPI002FC7B462